MVRIIEEDIFKAPVNIIIHQANCFNTMGAGIAALIKKRYPRAYEVDCMTKKGDTYKLGQFTFCSPNIDQDKWIINLYGQYQYGRDKRYTDYSALKKGFERIRNWLEKMGLENQIVGIPYGMGCKNGGGNWETVEQIIQDAFSQSKIHVLICKI